MSGIKIIRKNDNKEQQEAVKQLYNEKIKQVILKMPRGLSFEEKVEYLYSFLVNELSYDYECLQRTSSESGLVIPTLFVDIDDENVQQTYKAYSNTADPFSAFLHKKGLCAAYSKIFKDLCDRSGIKCEICYGQTAIVNEETGIRRGHAWNIVEDEYGRRSHVDVTFCMVSDEDLTNRGPHMIDEGTKPCNYTVTNHKKIQETLLRKLNGEELDTNAMQH